MDNNEKFLITETLWTGIYLLINPLIPPMFRDFWGLWAVFSMIIIFLTCTPKQKQMEGE